MLPIFVATKPLNSELGNIRGDCSIETLRNIVYWSASVESAEKEIKSWFKPEEIQNYKRD